MRRRRKPTSCWPRPERCRGAAAPRRAGAHPRRFGSGARIFPEGDAPGPALSHRSCAARDAVRGDGPFQRRTRQRASGDCHQSGGHQGPSADCDRGAERWPHRRRQCGGRERVGRVLPSAGPLDGGIRQEASARIGRGLGETGFRPTVPPQAYRSRRATPTGAMRTRPSSGSMNPSSTRTRGWSTSGRTRCLRSCAPIRGSKRCCAGSTCPRAERAQGHQAVRQDDDGRCLNACGPRMPP